MPDITIQNLYQQYKNDVYAYMISITHDKLLSEDLTSETFLGAIKSIPAYKGDSDVKTWLFSIARHKWYEHLRKQKKKLTNDDFMEMYAKNELNLEQRVITTELVEKVHKLLNEESKRNRNIVLLRVDGYSFYEIGMKHGISESSARVIDFRVKRKIRTILKKGGYSYD